VAQDKSRQAWDEARQGALIAQILRGKLSLKAACERYDLSAESVRDWVPVYRQKTLEALDAQLQQTFLVQGVMAERTGSAAYTGTLGDIPLPDLLQTYQMGKKDGVISVTRGSERSYLWCEKGELVDAESGRLRGEAAVYRILDFEHGQVFADFRFEARPRTIELSINMLLLEAAHQKDECGRLLQQLDGPHSIYRPAAGAMAVKTTPAEREALDLCDGERAVRDVLEASELADFETLSAMANLAERGYLLRDGTSIPPAVGTPIVGNETPHGIVFAPVAPSSRSAGTSRSHSAPLLVAVGLLLGTVLWMGVGALTGGALPSQSPWLARSGASPSASFVVEVNAEPANAQLWLDGIPVGQGRLRRELPRDGNVHRLAVVTEGHIPTNLLFVDASPPSRIVLEKLPQH
jgi:transposase-like protein